VIAVDTSTTHLAAAMGKPTWILNRYDTCWRWMLNRNDSPWYDSVTLYRQDDSRQWESILEKMAGDLTERDQKFLVQALNSVAATTLLEHEIQNYEIGLELLKKGKPLEALPFFESIIKNNPVHANALHKLGLIAFGLGDPKLAVEWMLQSIEINPGNADVFYDLGIAFQAMGLENQALTSYEHAIAIQPDFAEVYKNLGDVQCKLGRQEESIARYNSAIALQPDYVEAYINRGIAFYELRRLEDSIASYNYAIAIQPDFAEAYSNRGIALYELGRMEDAKASFDSAIVAKPDYSIAYNNRGNTLGNLGRLDEAVISYDRAVKIKPDYAQAWYNRGRALQELQRLEDAIHSYDRTIEINPELVEAHLNRGTALKELKRSQEALASCNLAIDGKPDYAEAWYNRGNVLQDLKRFNEAISSYDRAIEIKPDYADAYSNLGNSLKELNCLQEALSSYDRAIEIKPDYAEVYSNRGNVLKELNQLDAALASYDRAIEIKPNYADAYWNKSLALLLKGDFDLGWELYEWRWKTEEISKNKRNLPQPLWLGSEDLICKTILLHAEQGLGDAIQFCRFASLVKKRGAYVVMEVPKTLAGLLSGLEGVDEIIPKGEKLPLFDYHCPLLSLPFALKTDLKSIPNTTPYLRASTSKVASWKHKLGVKIKPRIGLAWSGSTSHKNDHNRSIKLKELLPILPKNYEYICLQKEIRDNDKKDLVGGEIRSFVDEIEDFNDTAGLCELMDVVISVDTSVAHLAAAMGKPTCLLLSHIPDWRWLMGREDSPWYETVKLYRQDVDRSWTVVLSKLALDLSTSVICN
jgi:tetratricopeptide (TPR) repeat protein/ADP-heptose:LPS heptosyltransferase